MMPAESESASVLLDCYGGDPLEQQPSSMEGTSSGEEEEEEEGGSCSPDGTGLSPETAAAPYVGQRFPTHDAAYELYSGFAKRCGFSIRRHRTEGKDGVGKGLTRRYFVCHRAGNPPAKPFADAAAGPQRNRRSSRCGCQAYMRIGRSAVARAGDPEWRVTGFSNHHNHELLGQDQVRLLPAYRVISGADKDRIMMFAKSGISVQQMMRIMELEKCLEPGNLPFTEKDVRNLIQSCRKFDQEESIDLIKMCIKFKEKDPNFKYEFTKDANNRLENIAWSFASSVQSYEMFGDAVVFDTTHRLSALDMLLGIWIPDHYLPARWRSTQPSPSKSLNGAHCGESPERVKALQSMVSALVTEASKSNERMDIATQEVTVLLSRIRQQPVVVHVSGDGVHKQR
ncbi:hypothetical protein E2562_023229 [Oryza meyeriana var. granulata]|uniref:Uncharacterized protein n=1 Tax=Oryza meyeriana var. granulata TaxID=110450 RepID=A0A6G1BYW8_9ORYZ|nr:hypothetical protein E2562_023229 [Oryza meyeriana var. granulata]